MNLFSLQLGDPISTKKLSIQGEKRIFDVYRVPIDYLVYNKKNGQWASTPSGKISWNIDRLIMSNGSCLIDFKNYKYYKDIS